MIVVDAWLFGNLFWNKVWILAADIQKSLAIAALKCEAIAEANDRIGEVAAHVVGYTLVALIRWVS